MQPRFSAICRWTKQFQWLKFPSPAVNYSAKQKLSTPFGDYESIITWTQKIFLNTSLNIAFATSKTDQSLFNYVWVDYHLYAIGNNYNFNFCRNANSYPKFWKPKISKDLTFFHGCHLHSKTQFCCSTKPIFLNLFLQRLIEHSGNY